MADGGLDLATWLTIPGIFLLFFGLPLGMLEYDRRKNTRESKQMSSAGAEREAAAQRRSDQP